MPPEDKDKRALPTASIEMRPPLVTVILTVFNRTRDLEGAVCSVVCQTLKSLELIVTDDANTEAARKICAQFAGDARIRYRANARTLGTPLNVAAALREARGKYVCILNDDDLLEPEMLERLTAPLEENTTCTLAFSNYRVINMDGAIDRELTSQHLQGRNRDGLPAGLIADSLHFALNWSVMAAIGTLFRREVLKPEWLVREVGASYDLWIVLCLARKGAFFHVPQFLAKYRVHSDSETSRLKTESLNSEVFMFEALMQESLPPEAASQVRQLLARFSYELGRNRILDGGDLPSARQAIERSLRLRFSLMPAFAWSSTLLPRAIRTFCIRHWLRWRVGPQN